MSVFASLRNVYHIRQNNYNLHVTTIAKGMKNEPRTCLDEPCAENIVEWKLSSLR